MLKVWGLATSGPPTAKVKPLFSISFQRITSLFLVLFLGFMVAAIWGAVSTKATLSALIAGASFPSALGMLFLWGYTRFARLDVRRIQFFEDRLTFSGAHGSGEFRYEEIDHVAQRKAAVFWVRTSQVLIFPKGERGPLVVATNPESKELQTDLGSWLRSKVRE